MNRFLHVQTLVVALGLVASQGCKSESARKADKAAENVVDKGKTLDDTLDRKMTEDVDRTKEIDKKAEALSTAATEFTAKKNVRIAALRAQLDAIASQPTLINSLAQSFPLSDVGRTGVGDKVKMFQTRVDDSAALINGLDGLPAEQWKAKDDEVTDAMRNLEDARNDAWKALMSAPRETRAS